MSVYTIYRYVYNNETIYVGKTKRNLKLRVSEHSIEDKFLPYLDECKIEFFDAGNRQSMDIYEKYLINEMSPILNVVDKENANFIFTLPYMEWKPYEMYVYNKKSPDKQPFRTVGQEIKKKQANIQRSIRACQNRIEKLEKELGQKQSLLSFLAWHSVEDFISDNSGDVYFSIYGELPTFIHAVIDGEHKNIPVYTRCYISGDDYGSTTYVTKKEYINDVFEYGLKDLAFDLESLTRKVIDENMLLRERQLEKEKLRFQHYN